MKAVMKAAMLANMASLARRQRLSTARDTVALFTGLANITPRNLRLRVCSSCRHSSTALSIGSGLSIGYGDRRSYSQASQASQATAGPKVTLGAIGHGQKEYATDSWFNLNLTVESAINRNLHVQKDHPISITRSIIESKFPAPTYKHYTSFFPVVSTHQNFDSLGFPKDHPGRSKSDTYYINEETVLRTHTSAHQADIFRTNKSAGYTISADVYRRDAIDRTHYPVFHQMEGARVWDRKKVPGGDIVAAVLADLADLPQHDMIVEDPNPPIHPERNPLQVGHSDQEAEAIAAHLKRSLELVVAEIFSRAKAARIAADAEYQDEPLKVRWVEAYFPFTSPSWELEIFWQGDWLEVLGCGVVKQAILDGAGVPSQMGWAFGLGLERIAMLLFEVPDIRLFWSQDERFLSQFKDLSSNLNGLKSFAPFSKHPSCYRDISFWLKSTSSAAGDGSAANTQDFHENDFMEIMRDSGGEFVEDVKKLEEYTQPTTGRKSVLYRVKYSSWERTLTMKETHAMHESMKEALVAKLGVEIR